MRRPSSLRGPIILEKLRSGTRTKRDRRERRAAHELRQPFKRRVDASRRAHHAWSESPPSISLSSCYLSASPTTALHAMPRYTLIGSSSLSSLRSKRTLWAAGIVLVAAVSLLSYRSADSSWLKHGFSGQPVRPPLSKLTTGRWLPRHPPFARVQDFLGAHETVDTMECEGGGPRALQVANWVWQPAQASGGCEWDKQQAIDRLLAMPDGLLLVGDSLGSQMFAAFRSMLGQEVQERHAPRQASLHLSPSNEAYSSAHQVGSDPFERLKRPLLTLHSTRHLVDNQTIANLVRSSEPGAVVSQAQTAQHWPYERDGDWWSSLEAAVARGEAGQGDTVVVISTGPHWHRLKFVHVPDSTLGDETILDSMQKLADYTLLRLPSSTHLHVIFKGNNPAMGDCSTDLDLGPLTASSENAPAVDTGARYNYDLFPKFDEIWRSAINEYKGRARVEFLDIRA